MGNVAGPGIFYLDYPITLVQVIARSGGFTEWASKKEILLLRNVDGEDKILRINYKHIIKGKDFDQNVRIEPDNTIIVS